MPENYITPEVTAMIGLEVGPIVAWDPVERGAVRRFAQAMMDPDPVYWDDAYAAQTRYGGIIAPPLFPIYLFRPAPTAPDILQPASEDPDFDGTAENFIVWFGLPPLPLTLKRMLNGGTRLRFAQYARLGDRVQVRSRYRDVYQKQARDGSPLVFVIVQATFTNQRDDLLLTCEQTLIWR